MGKNIVIFCDGTNQKGGEGYNTNVYKLFNMIEDRSPKQIAYYDPGLGTDFRKISGAAFGNGFYKNVIECYRFIFDHYETGDQLYFFGFSRGAATVRSLASFIHLFGILPKSRPDLIQKAMVIYKKNNRNGLAKAFIDKHHTMWTKIKFVGVWDTVAALGVPIRGLDVILDRFRSHTFHDFRLGEGVEHARQALAIDDERQTFHPIIWDPISEQKNKTLKQVWFAGVHTDIGGGYEQAQLSDISLKWMLREATQHGLLIYEKSKTHFNLLATTSNSNGHMHNEQTGFMGKLFRRKVRTWKQEIHGQPCVHESVMKRINNPNNKPTPKYAPWILGYLDPKNPNIEE